MDRRKIRTDLALEARESIQTDAAEMRGVEMDSRVFDTLLRRK